MRAGAFQRQRRSSFHGRWSARLFAHGRSQPGGGSSERGAAASRARTSRAMQPAQAWARAGQ
eukprot:1515063-Lingulodinium_polyedra.AAC.1